MRGEGVFGFEDTSVTTTGPAVVDLLIPSTATVICGIEQASHLLAFYAQLHGVILSRERKFHAQNIAAAEY